MTATLRKPTLYHFIQDYWHQDIVKTIMIAVMQKGIGVAYPSTLYYWTNLSKIYKEYQNNYEDQYKEALADLLVFLLESKSLPTDIINLITGA